MTRNTCYFEEVQALDIHHSGHTMAAPPFKVKAVYEYTSEHDDDLNFPIGQVINVTELEGEDWYVGEYTDVNGARREGLFPRNFVEKYEPEVPTRPVRTTRPKSVVSPPPVAAAAPAQQPEELEQEAVPPVPAASKPQPPPVEIPTSSRPAEEEVRSPPSASTQKPPVSRAEPPAAPKPAAAEPDLAAAAPSKAGPPPVAPKSNAFKDRIAAFNKVEQAPIAPIGRQSQRNDYIKKPFVAPPPSSHAYVPPMQKSEPVHRPYIREEDPEIRQRQEEDRAAAEAAGLAGERAQAEEEAEAAPKPMSLKERMALLQKEQEAARSRHAEAAQKKKPQPPTKKVTDPSDAPAEDEEGEELERVPTQRKSLEVARERPRVPSAQRRPAEPKAPVPAGPEHENLSGGEEADQSGAGDMTEDDAGTIGAEESEEKFPANPPPTRVSTQPTQQADVGNDEDTTEEAEDDEEEEMDEEEQRKQRLRERMARLAGGQGGGGLFNPFGMPPAAAPAKKRSTKEKKSMEEEEGTPSGAPQVPQMMPIPGMGGAISKVQSPESDATERASGAPPVPEREVDDTQERPPPPRRSATMDRAAPPPVPQDRPVPGPSSQERGAPPPVPADSRPVPRPPPTESRPVPPPPPAAAPLSPGPGSESDDEMSMHAKRSSAEGSGLETPLPNRTGGAPPVPARDVATSPSAKRTSYFGSEPSSATSERRASRQVPPVPGLSSPTSPRPPPPPPPTANAPSRQGTGLESAANDETERGESDYEGDYDTDIASGAKHKDALRSHAREPSGDDSATADEGTPVSTPAPPPPPRENAPTAVPPPPPQQAPPKSRPSGDTPRAPPPVPPAAARSAHDDEYDPYRYSDGSRAPPPVPGAIPVAAPPIPPEPEQIQEESSADELPPPPARRSTDRAPPPAPHTEPPLPQQPPPTLRAPTGRQSLEVPRGPAGRRSTDADRGQMAQDLDLAQGSQWWTASQPLPPSLQSRNGLDILSESEESQKSKRGGRTTISKDIYILYMDYSQTVITAQYDSRDPSDVSLEQRHEPPPPQPRQDQLESYWQRFGKRISEKARAAGNSKKETTVGDGAPASLPLELIRALPDDPLHPVGTRAYGALVYSNLANASTQQFDEIRPGDIVTVRNGKFEGHHGAMKTRYKTDYGAGHVGVAEEWDGTRKSLRMWEQGREKKGGVRSEKLRLGDLRSGEVKVWRVVGREYVGWESG